MYAFDTVLVWRNYTGDWLLVSNLWVLLFRDYCGFVVVPLGLLCTQGVLVCLLIYCRLQLSISLF